MARNSINWRGGAAVAAVVLAFAPVASAATWRVGVGTQLTYATESITSEDVVINFRGTPPAAQAFVTLTDDEATSIDRGDTMDLTFTLVNAKFARAVRASALSMTFSAGVAVCRLRVQSVDSEAGGASATFTVETTRADCALFGSNLRQASFELALPPLTGLTNTKPVNVKITADAPGGSGWPSLSAAQDIRGSRPFITYRNGFTFSSLASRLSTRIDLAAGRTRFTFPGQATLPSVLVGRANANLCTRRDPPYARGSNACTRQADGSPFSLGKGGDGRGFLNVAARGNFRDGDVVFLDLDGNRAPDSGEYLDLQDDGSMRQSFSLDHVAGNPDAAEGEAGDLDREEGAVLKNLYYRPNGVDALRPGEYRTSFSVTTTSNDVADLPALAGLLHTTSYTLVEDQRIAHAIPSPGAADSVRVRVKCEAATPCTLYLECDVSAGQSYFAQVEEPVPGRSTLALTAEALSDALGIQEGDWEDGPMSCSIYSTRKISVQQLTRSGGVLANITYVDN